MAEKKTELELLKEEAIELGIDVKGNWGVPKLTAEIEKVKASLVAEITTEPEVEENNEPTVAEDETVEEIETVKEIEEEPNDIIEEVKPKKESKADKWLYQGKVIRDNKVLELLKEKVNEKTALEMLELMRTGQPYASAEIGYITFIGKVEKK